MKKLQKHQAFEAEIVANTDRIEKIKEVSQISYLCPILNCQKIKNKILQFVKLKNRPLSYTFSQSLDFYGKMRYLTKHLTKDGLVFAFGVFTNNFSR